jgi:very-short-patch-repair endonuclease
VEIETRVRRGYGGESSPRPDDAAIAALAARQYGVVARAQVAALGIGQDAIDRRLALRRLHALHRGVFAVGHTVVSREGAWLAAVLACGHAAVLSHRSAAAHWEMRGARQRDVDVIAPRRVDRPGIRARRIVLPHDEVTVHDRIPVTTVARTLFDLAGVLTPQQLEAAITEAEGRRLGSPTSLADLVARHPHHRGVAALKTILLHAGEIGRTRTRSELEIDLLALVDAHGLPRPRTNGKVGGHEVDAVWADERLIVELDSFGIHTTRRSFERDRARDREMTAAGWRVVRITWRQLHHDAIAVAAELAALLDQRHHSSIRPKRR